MSNDTKTVLLSGVGGQGAILAADILSRVAMACGQDVKLSEIHGMAQRGGAVTTVVRLGDSVASMVADKGSVDYLVSFEKVEALRNIEFLKDGGALLVNDEFALSTKLNYDEATWLSVIESRVPAKFKDVNIAAFKLGRKFVEEHE